MGYLSNQNNEIIVDAILTKYGREKLSSEGILGVTKFALADDEIDYSLYNTDHPLGSDYYDIAIRQLPVLEALPSNDLSMKYHLFTVRGSGVSDDGGAVSTVYVLDVSTPSEFSSNIGITRTSTDYQFTPYTSPAVPDKTKIFYIAELVDTFNLPVSLTSVIDPTIGLTNDLAQEADVYKSKETATRKFAVGHTFKFKIDRLPAANRTFTVNVRAGGEYSVRPKTFRIFVKNRNFALGSDIYTLDV